MSARHLTTPSSATAERGTLAAWGRKVEAGSSQRDARSSSLQRMVRPRFTEIRENDENHGAEAM